MPEKNNIPVKKQLVKTSLKTTPQSKAGEKPRQSLPRNAGDEVYLREEYYRKGFHTAWLIAKVSVAYALVVSLLLVYLATRDPQLAYFATTQDGKTIQLMPLQFPNQSDPVVSSWAETALINTFNYNFYDYKTVMNDAIQKYFTSDGGAALITELKASHIIDEVTENEYFVSMAASQHPVITAKGGSDDVFAWQLEVPVVITYRNQKAIHTNNMVVQMVVVRRSNLTEPSGLGISKIIMKKV